MNTKSTLLLVPFAGALILGGCVQQTTGDYNKALSPKDEAITTRQADPAATQQQTQQVSPMTKAATSSNFDSLLPPAKPGECYTRILVPANYKTVPEKVLKKEAGEKIELVSGKYGLVEEKVLTEEGSAKLIPMEARYGTEAVKYQISSEKQYWAINLKQNAPAASEGLLASARKAGIQLDNATPGTCFHEHYIAPKYKTVIEKVLVSEASEKITVTPAKYETVSKKILIKEASYKLVAVPEQYKTVSEKILVEPARTVWKKGTGPVEKLDQSTGEIVCLVEIPARYKTIQKTVLASAATTKKVAIPAEYKTIQVRKLVAPAQEKRTLVPAQYKTVKKIVLESDGQFIWHDVHDKHLTPQSRTGNQICLVKIPAKSGSYIKKVVTSKAATKKVSRASRYQTIKVQKVVASPLVKRTKIAAQYQTVSKRIKVSEEHMEWVPILCETNFNANLITDLQRQLKASGHNPGKIDGIYGIRTKAAVGSFQRAKGIKTGTLTLETLKALGIKY